MLIIRRKFSVQFSGCRLVRFLRLFRGLEKTEVTRLAFVRYEGRPSIAILSLVYAFYAALVVGLRTMVVKVLSMRCRSDFGPSVVGSLLFFMVYLLSGPLSGHYQVGESMGKVEATINSNLDVPVRAFGASNMTRPSSWGSINQPSEMPRSWIIGKYRPHILCGHFGHGVSLVV